ncbi:MAG: M48 family metalloprotease [Candidatus Pelagadaptatus aseana]|uniref:M48 family metalloprotease n=1 Tax=Candidatus Pelagadaptatus aseana TaxID=3120508 RepID=UPI0039B33E8B
MSFDLKHAKQFLQRALFAGALMFQPTVSQAQNYNLPSLGDSTSATISPQKEYELGQAWLRSFRSKVPANSDALTYVYLEQLLNRLARHSQLSENKLELVVVNNPSMNAFAVPGGVVGVHTGLFLHAESEGQLASVLSHELAHLSQRHFARSVAKQQQNTIPMMAAMLASLVIAATTGGDAGLAAITATQAAALDSQLRFSRQNEQEADRIGMQTMVAAEMDPHSVAEMFERMLRTTRYSRRPPEFLLTHPVTESRIADALNRAQKYPKRSTPSSLDFHLMRARATLLHTETPEQAVKRFRSELEGDTLSEEASRYGLVIALNKSHQYQQATEAIIPLLQQSPDKVAYVMARADTLAGQEDFTGALQLVEQHLQQQPGNHPLTVRYAELLMRNGNYPLCEEVLTAHIKRRPKDDYVWYLLAEAHGLAGNIYGVHTARAEYFILNGVLDKARQQLENALALVKDNYMKRTLLEERIRQLNALMEDTKL